MSLLSTMNYAILAGALVACGQSNTQMLSNIADTEDKADSVNQPLMIVVNGGWNSCKGSLFYPGGYLDDQFARMRQDLAAVGLEAHWFTTCYKGGTPATRPLYFSSSDRYRGYGSFDYIAGQLTKRIADHRLYMIGHSYGGWATMTLADRIDHPIAGIFTLEAIHGRKCTQRDNRPRFAGRNPECKTFPTVGAEFLTQLAGRVDKWINLYVDPSISHRLKLRSGPANTPGIDDRPLQITNRSSGLTEHHFLGFDRLSWLNICGRIMKDHGRSDQDCHPWVQTNEYGRGIR